MSIVTHITAESVGVIRHVLGTELYSARELLAYLKSAEKCEWSQHTIAMQARKVEKLELALEEISQ